MEVPHRDNTSIEEAVSHGRDDKNSSDTTAASDIPQRVCEIEETELPADTPEKGRFDDKNATPAAGHALNDGSPPDTQIPHETPEQDIQTPESPNNEEPEKAVSQKPKKGAGEAFLELKSAVMGMDLKLDEISRFLYVAKDKLIRQADACVLDGKMQVLESFFELHDTLFRRVMAMEAGSMEPDRFSIELLEYMKELLGRHGVDVIIPQPGDPFDMMFMESIRAAPARFWRIPGTVANVEKCGYVMQDSDAKDKLLRPARVVVYRKLNERRDRDE